VNDLKDECFGRGFDSHHLHHKKMKKIPLLLLLLLLIPTNIFATTPIIEGLDSLKVSQNKLQQVAAWKRIPAVVVCSAAPVERQQVVKTLDMWKKLGYVFYSGIYFKDSMAATICRSTDLQGYIIVDLVTQETFGKDDDLAVTHFYIDNDTREIHWAKIYLKINVEERVLEHEFGHALGWMHSKKPGHLMHEKWIRGGWETDGLKK